MVDKWAKSPFVASLKEIYYLELDGMFLKIQVIIDRPGWAYHFF